MLAVTSQIFKSLRKDNPRALLLKLAVSSSSAAERPVMKPHTLQFYRRPLPPSCIDFASAEGKTIFAEALATGHMNSFFKLSTQYRTQDEPAYCGLTSLVMALNVLEIDPGRVWKGPWRWYHEDMLDCCTSLQLAREKGINMEQFICLARCNNLSVQAVSGSSILSLEELRAQIQAATLRDDVVFVASYSRKTLSQTGDGHFSPIAGYHEGRDLVLILDTARFKYPPHWVPMQTLLDAMKTVDPDTGRSRGYAILSSAKNQPSLLLFRPSPALTIEKDKCSARILQFAKDWAKYLNTQTSTDQKEVIQMALSHLRDLKCKKFLSVAFFGLTLPYEVNKVSGDSFTVHCPQMGKGEEKVTCLIKNLITELESLDTFKAVKEFFIKEKLENKSEFLSFIQMDGLSCEADSPDVALVQTKLSNETACCSQEVQDKCTAYRKLRNEVVLKESGNLKDCTDCEGALTIRPEHAATLFLQVWPHMAVNLPPSLSDSAAQVEESSGSSSQDKLTLGSLLKEYVSLDLTKSNGCLVKDEINTIKVKIGELLTYHGQCGTPPQCCSPLA
ncbi:glutathione gamma-glutamylcysteinyltransferase 2 isoform X1 [Biomphalaria pfeifferi]|uniref:glutathione gamma-glutamylcysteinyltransferase n=1 Tax=Biomphalaria pfeifferi TaxID=112525 RepID=A0AAD8F2I7_BIOPF|nr:glutathione gamma-glutamylcysteinyltransferase 2 isoform X1 [Biomphalaria pfeifferi]